jgi:hypothetical protein
MKEMKPLEAIKVVEREPLVPLNSWYAKEFHIVYKALERLDKIDSIDLDCDGVRGAFDSIVNGTFCEEDEEIITKNYESLKSLLDTLK